MENEGQFSVIGEASPGIEMPNMMQQYSAASMFSPNVLAFDPLVPREGTFNMPQQHHPASDALTPAPAAFDTQLPSEGAANVPQQHRSATLTTPALQWPRLKEGTCGIEHATMTVRTDLLCRLMQDSRARQERYGQGTHRNH